MNTKVVRLRLGEALKIGSDVPVKSNATSRAIAKFREVCRYDAYADVAKCELDEALSRVPEEDMSAYLEATSAIEEAVDSVLLSGYRRV